MRISYLLKCDRTICYIHTYPESVSLSALIQNLHTMSLTKRCSLLPLISVSPLTSFSCSLGIIWSTIEVGFSIFGVDAPSATVYDFFFILTRILVNCLYRITQNNWIGVHYTWLERTYHNFVWALLVHINFLNNSCNFILYILTAPSFRKQLVAMFTNVKVKVNVRWTSTVAPMKE